VSDLSDVECELRQLEIVFVEEYERNGNDVRDMVAVVTLRDEEIGRVSLGRAATPAQLRRALERLVYFLVDVLPD